MLEIKSLSKIYTANKKAVDDLSLSVAPGEIYGFIGHNGAGKTTTLRCIAGIISFNAGSITVAGHDVLRDSVAAKKALAFLPDNPDIYEFLKGDEYLKLIADLYGIPESKRLPLISKYADAFEITGNLGSQISGYSHGMKQKLALVSAFMREPLLLILDEPFVGLDPKAAYLMKGFLRELCDKGGAVFFSSHVLDVVEKLCDKIAIIKNGKLIEAGPTAEIKGKKSLETVFLELEGESGENTPLPASPPWGEENIISPPSEGGVGGGVV
jgi:ABC-2 type transport system ATP-binding protein